jgi:hypothetical protein
MPILVLIAVPLTVLGGVWALVLGGVGAGIYALIGVFALLGLTVNPAILLVDRMQQRLMRTGCSGGSAAIGAVRERTRPVLMTSCTLLHQPHDALRPPVFKVIDGDFRHRHGSRRSLGGCRCLGLAGGGEHGRSEGDSGSQAFHGASLVILKMPNTRSGEGTG